LVKDAQIERKEDIRCAQVPTPCAGVFLSASFYSQIYVFVFNKYK